MAKQKTSLFNNKEFEEDYLKGFSMPKGRVYHIDDCYIKQELESLPDTSAVSNLSKLYNGTLPQYIEEKVSKMCGDVPIMSYEQYLKEYKDAILQAPENVKNQLTRLWVNGSSGMEVGNVIITNRKPGKYSIINELYLGSKLIKCVEYDLEQMLKCLNEVGVAKQVPQR